ncbi:MAG: Ig-like domain-containing protein [Candidatus Bruticola sp.]
MDSYNSLACSKGSRRWLGLCLFAIAFLFAALVSGCGGSGSSGSGGGAPAKEYSDVIFHFNNLASEKVLARAVPENTAFVRFTGSSSSREVLYGPVIKDYAATIILEKVPVKVSGFVLECLNSEKQLTAVIPVSVQMNCYGDTVVNINDYKPLSSVVKNITVKPTEINDLLVGYSESISAIATLSDGQIVDLTPYMTFTSSDPEVATVEQNGYDGAKVTASKGGETTISGSVLGVSMPDISVSVSVGVVESKVIFEPESLSVAPSRTRPASALVVFNDGTTKALDPSQVTYSVAPEGVVTIEPSTSYPSQVYVTGSTGAQVGDTATVTMTASLSGKTFTADLPVTISDAVIDSIEISNVIEHEFAPGENKIFSKGTPSESQFTATAHMSDSTSQNVTSQVTWKSNTPNVASFSDDTAGLLQAKESGVTTVTAELDGITSNSITITVVEPSVTELKVEGIADANSGIVVFLGENPVAYPLKVKAVYDNTDEVYVNISDGLVCEHITNGSVLSEEYVKFEDKEEAETETHYIEVSGIRATSDLTSSQMKFTYNEVSSDLIKVTVQEKAVTDFTISFKDQTTGKEYSVDTYNENTVLGVPWGRKYDVIVRGYWTNPNTGEHESLGEITGNYKYGYQDGNTVANQGTYNNLEYTSTDLDHPIIFDDVKLDKYGVYWSESGTTIETIEEQFSDSLFTSEATRGECSYTGTGGTITVVGVDKTNDKETFRVCFRIVKPAIDSYMAMSYGDISRQGDLSTFDVPRGVNFDITDGSFSHRLVAVMSNLGEEGREHATKDVTEFVNVDDNSITDFDTKLLTAKVSDNVYSSVTADAQYAERNLFNTEDRRFDMTGVVLINDWDKEDHLFGAYSTPAETEWQSFNCEMPEFTLRLERPRITNSFAIVYSYGDAGEIAKVDIGADNYYHFKEGDKFTYCLREATLSDGSEAGSSDFIIQTDSKISGFSNNGTPVFILKHIGNAASADPYEVITDETFANGFKSTISITPNNDTYYDAVLYSNTMTVFLDKP